MDGVKGNETVVDKNIITGFHHMIMAGRLVKLMVSCQIQDKETQESNAPLGGISKESNF